MAPSLGAWGPASVPRASSSSWPSPASFGSAADSADGQGFLPDLGLIDYGQLVKVPSPQDPEALMSLRRATAARVAVGRAGPRYLTETLLRFRADHALAMDAVFTEVSPRWLEASSLPVFKTVCQSKDEFLTRPDLGRQLAPDQLEGVRRLASGFQVVVYVSDGLSTAAVEANALDAMKSLAAALGYKGISASPPFFVQYGRVPAEDAISEATGCDVVCVLIGERPGLNSAESMSAYLAYKAAVNMPEARRTVVSNIHKGGTPAVEAGGYIGDLIERMLEKKASGLDLRL
jgi:ethanolamine ammonia-lyase small subunit